MTAFGLHVYDVLRGGDSWVLSGDKAQWDEGMSELEGTLPVTPVSCHYSPLRTFNIDY